MLTKTVLSAKDVAGLLSAVFEYNQRGPVAAITFYDGVGTPIDVGYLEVVSEEPGLRVRTSSEQSAEDLARQVNPPVEDPRKVTPAAELGALAKLAEAK